MTLEQTKIILAALKAAYPHAFKDMDKNSLLAVLALWHRQFADEDARVVTAAVDALIATRTEGYSPTIGEVKTMIRKISAPEKLSEQEAWALVSKAIENGYYGSQQEYDKLPPEVRETVGSPKMLWEWSQLPVDEVQTVVASNFQRSYKTCLKRAEDRAALPESVRALIAEAAAAVSLPPAAR